MALTITFALYGWLYFTINNMINKGEAISPDIVRVRSSGAAAELYPDSLGDYKLSEHVTHNNLPVYHHLARDDRYIVNIGTKETD